MNIFRKKVTKQLFKSLQKRDITTWIPTKQKRLDNSSLQLLAKQFAKDSGTTYKSPMDMSKGRVTTKELEEPFHVIVDQADIRQHGSVVDLFKKNFGHTDVFKKTREMTLLSCHGGTKNHGGRSRITDLSEYFNKPVTGPKGQLKLSSDGLSPIIAEVGKMEKLDSPFKAFALEDSLVTARGKKEQPTSQDHSLYKAIQRGKSNQSKSIYDSTSSFAKNLAKGFKK